MHLRSLLASRRKTLVKPLLLVVVGLLALALAGCGGGSKSGGGGGSTAASGDAAKGKDVFMGTCAACHGQDAKGLPGLGKDLVVPSDWLKQQDEASLIAFIKQGRPANDPLNTNKVDMPPKGGNPALTDADIANVVAYLFSIQK